jgi:hypothetical protein
MVDVFGVGDYQPDGWFCRVSWLGLYAERIFYLPHYEGGGWIVS